MLVIINMNCVDYNKHGLFICVDNIFCYISLVIKKVIAIFMLSLCILK